jgi:O-antigen/teichoic acid export membrane protein
LPIEPELRGMDRSGLPVDPPPVPQTKPAGFLKNVLWNWLGISVSIFSAFILSPIIIRRLGDEGYGLWALTTSLVEYYWLLDFGMRSATIRFSAHYNARRESDQINQVINTTIAYALCLFPLLIGSAWLGAPVLMRVLSITHPLFRELLFIVVIAWGLTSLLSVFTSCLEGFQRFDLTTQSTVISIAVRSFGTLALLLKGYGVVAVAVMTMIGQVLLHLISYIRMRGVFREMKITPRFVKLAAFKEMITYGAHSVVASMAQRILSQSPPFIIAHFLGAPAVGYYAAPTKVLDYSVETVTRIGNVSNSRAAQFASAGQKKEVLELAISANRYSLALFLPLTIFLAVYGPQFLLVWIKKPYFAGQSAGVLLALLAGITLGNAAQFNSASILFGIGKHQRFARAMFVEAALMVAGSIYVLPRYGLVPMAALGSGLMVINRAFITPWLLTRELETSYWRFLARVNLPLLAVLPVGGILLALKRFVPGVNWPQLILAGAVTVLAYLPIVYACIQPHHRVELRSKLRTYSQRIGVSRAPA